MEPQCRIAIVGGGFAGIEVARRLRKRLPASSELVLYSEENHFVFTPLLTEVVGASINPLHVVWPIREMVPGASCRTVPVVALDVETRELVYEGRQGQLGRDRYDHLILAPGLAAHLDILPGMATHGWPLKILGDALVLRNRLITQLERAEVETDPARRERLLSFVVVGGGFTGAEVAGSVADLLREASRFYHNVHEEEIRVTVVEMAPRILGGLPESLSDFAERKMRQRGIDIRCGVQVERVTARGIELAGGEHLPADTVIAAVGNTTRPLLTGAGLPMEGNRLRVTSQMRVEGHENLWALGDCAAVPNARDGQVSPTTAQYATRQAKQLAENLLAVLDGREPEPFRYKPQGMFAAIGHRNAVGQVFGLRLSGFFAWFLWHGLYWAKMPSAIRKVQIALDWALNYLFPPDIVEIGVLTTRRAGRIDEVGFLRLASERPELRELPVREWMSRPVATLPRETSLGDALRRLRETRTHALPVVDEGGAMVGICTRSDLYRAVRALDGLDTPVEELMSRPVITVPEDATLDEAVRATVEHQVKRLVVVSAAAPDRPAGILTPFDVLASAAREGEEGHPS
jgi:NADH dehydrogenase